MLFKKSDLAMPDFWSYLQEDHWRDFGFVQPQGLGVFDLNGDNVDDLIFVFWQDVGYLNYGIDYTGDTPTRIVLLESSKDGYRDATSDYFPGLEKSVDGFVVKPTLVDANGDGFTDLWWAANQEDGRDQKEWEPMYARALLHIYDPVTKKFDYYESDSKAWHFASGKVRIGDQEMFWASGTSTDSPESYFDPADPGKMIGAAPLYSFDANSKKIELHDFIPSTPVGTVPVDWLAEGNLDYVVADGRNTAKNSNFLGVWQRTGNTWQLLSQADSGSYIDRSYISWTQNIGTLRVDPETRLTEGVFLSPALLRLSENTHPVITYLKSSVQFPEVTSERLYYEYELLPQRYLEFWRLEGFELEKLDIRVINESRDFNTERSEIKDVNRDGIDDFVSYPYDDGSPVVYLGTGGDAMVAVPKTAFPSAPVSWGQGIATSYFMQANQDDVWDVLIYPGQAMPNEWREGENIYRTDVNASPLIYLGTSSKYEDHIFDSVEILDRLDSNRIKTFSGNDVFYSKNSADGITQIDGYLGLDTAVYENLSDTYEISKRSGEWFVSKSGAENGDLLFNVERLRFADVSVALDIDGIAAEAYRIYKAAFDRQPDLTGLGFWIKNMDSGMGLEAVAQEFINSAEFIRMYGPNPTDEQFVDLLYANVLDRQADQSGYDFWIGALDRGLTRAGLLAEFSESRENVANVSPLIEDGIQFTAFVG